MASKWDQYEVQDTSKWDKYAISSEGEKVPFAKQDLWTGTGEQWKETGKGFVFGAGNIPVGLKQLDTSIRAAAGISPQSESEEYNKYVTERAAGQGTSSEFKLGKAAGEFAVTAPIPGGAQGGFLRRLLMSTLQGAGIGAMQPVPKGESRASNTLIGGAAGAGGQTVLSTSGKVLNLFKPVERETAELGRKFGTRLSLGDITQNPRIQKAEILLEDIPIIGTGRFRKSQSADTSKLAGQVLAGYSIDPTLTSTAAIKEANDMYLDNVYEQIAKTGKEMIPMAPKSLRGATSELLERYPDIFTSIQDANSKKILTDIYESTKPLVQRGAKTTVVSQPQVIKQSPTVSQMMSNIPVKDVTKPGVIVTGGGENPLTMTEVLSGVTKKDKTVSWDALWMLRKAIGKEYADAKTDTAKGIFAKVYGAVTDDMETMVDASGRQLGRDFKHANEEFKRLSVKFDAIREAYDKAIGTTSAKEVFSPKTFSTNLKKLANDPNYKSNIKWKPDEVDYLTGVASIMQYAKRAGEYMERPPTGSRPIPLYLAAHAVGLATGGAASGSAIPFEALGTEATLAGLATVLTTTEIGKRIALNASKLNVHNPKFMALIDEAYQQIPKLGAIAATQENKKKSQLPWMRNALP